MNVERAMEFLIRNQACMDARMDAKFDRADQRFAQAEKRFAEGERRTEPLEPIVAENNRMVTRLARAGVTLRSDVRKTEKNLAEVSEKLNILTDVVDRQFAAMAGTNKDNDVDREPCFESQHPRRYVNYDRTYERAGRAGMVR